MNMPRRQAKTNKLYRVVWGPQRFYLSIGWKTLIAFALVVFIPMFGLMFITSQTLRDAMEAETIHSLEANLRGAWRVYHERLNGVRAALIQSAASPEVIQAVRSADGPQLKAMLNRNATLLPFTDLWLVLDEEQRVLARRNGLAGQPIYLNNLVTRAFTFMEAVSSTEIIPNELFLEENPLKYSSLETQVMAQVVVVPVHQKDAVVGALVGLILLNDDAWLPNAIHDYLSIDAALFGSIIQESRIISASTRPNNIWATGLLAPPSLNTTIRNGALFRGKTSVNDIPAFVIAEPIYNLEGDAIGALSIGVKSSNIESLIQSNAKNIYLSIGLGIFLSLIVAYLAYRDTMTPMRAIRKAMDAFASGQLDIRTEIRTKDEFQELGEGFNRMAAAIHEHQRRVESFNSLSSLLITSLKPRELMKSVLDKVVQLTESQAGMIYLQDSEDGVLIPYISYAVDVDAMEFIHYGQGLPGEAAQSRRTILIKDIPSDCKINVNFGIADTLPNEIAIFPIVYRDKVLGVMLLATMAKFRNNEIALLESMTNQIAIVLENALTHEKVERLSITDALTGIYNRHYLAQRLGEEFAKSLRYGSALSLLIIDVDHFKQVNDQFGHQVGDEALVSVAKALRAHLRDTDMLARYGGEEFVVMLPHTEKTNALATAEKLRQGVEKLAVSGMDGRPISVSIGVASYPDEEIAQVDDLVRHADAALYEAKERGRNRVVAA